MTRIAKPLRETPKQAGYVRAESFYKGEVVLTDVSGKRELWFCNKNHASYGLIYKNTHLEFIRSLP